MLAAYPDIAGDLGDEVVDVRVFRGCRTGSGGKRFRQNKKNSSTPCARYGSIPSTDVEEVAPCGVFRFFTA